MYLNTTQQSRIIDSVPLSSIWWCCYFRCTVQAKQ